MRKSISVLISMVLILVFVLSGCSKPAKVKPVNITLWHYYNADIKTQFDDLVFKFNETVGKEKGIMVDAYSQGGVNELADAVLSAANKEIGAKEMPDIFSAYSDSAYRLHKLGVVADLDEYFSQEEIELYREEFIDDGRFGDDKALKIIPVAKSTELLYINMTAFLKFSEETGVLIEDLATWEGIVSSAEKYYDWSNGKSMFGIDSLSNFMITATKQLGEAIFSISDDKVSFNLSKENAKKLWDTYYVPFLKGHIAAVGRFRSDDVKSGKIIMFTGSNSSASFFPTSIETGKDTSYNTVPMVISYPYFQGKDKVSIHQGAGMVVTKSNNETEKACAEFLKWLTAPQQNLKFAAGTSYLPVQNQALSYEKNLEVLENKDELNVKVQTNKALYEMLKSYKLYATVPFEKSFETRNILNSSLLNKVQQDLTVIDGQTSDAQERNNLINIYIGEDNFTTWYNQITKDITALLA